MSGVYLVDADLSDANLSGAYLGDAELVMADLSDADLRGANFIGAQLDWADLGGADLRGADFTDAIFNATNFSEATIGITHSDRMPVGCNISFDRLGHNNSTLTRQDCH